jgi:hypothetical protein
MLRVLFSGSRFIFWALAPVLILGAAVFSVSVDYSSPIRVALVIFLDSLAVLLALGLYSPRRNEWALRLVTGLVFVAYVGYLVEEIREGKPLHLTGGRGEQSLRNAILGLILIGWPCIKFTLLGFDGWRHEDESDEQGNPDSYRSDDLRSGDLE